MAAMDDLLERLRSLGDQARAFAGRHGLDWRHGAATVGVLVAGTAIMGLSRGPSGETHSVIDPDQRLKIEVVQPVEPVFTSGPVMEVGTLVDAFDPTMLREAAVTGPDSLALDPYADQRPMEREGFFRRFSSAIQQALPHREERPPPRIRREDRSYGFDGPRPDWQAEREARRAWRERIEAERRDEREMRDRDERERYEAARRERGEMRQRMGDPGPDDPQDDEPVG